MPVDAATSLSRRAAARLGAGGLATVLATRGPGSAAAQDATPGAFPPLLEAWAAAWSSGDVDRVAVLYASDALYEEVPYGGIVARGQEEIRELLAAVPFAAFPDDLRIELLSGFLADGWAAAEWRQTGTQTGVVGGNPPTGRTVDFRGASIFELDGDKIRRESVYLDWYTVALQLGLISEPEAEATPTAATPEA